VSAVAVGFSLSTHLTGFRAMEEMLELNLPEYPGSDQIVELDSTETSKI
jgi:hypothetical protein